MKKLILTIWAVSCVMAAVNAQDGSDYKRGIGVRIGGGYYDVAAASFKTFITKPGAIELNLGFRPYSAIYSSYSQFHLSFSASYQHHFPIGNVEGLRWFIGGGATVYNTFSSNEDLRGFGLGLFPTGGADYKFNNIPLNVSADFRPTIAIIRPDYYGYSYLSTYSRFYAGNVGVSARYTF
ncbi:MAG: hypothetical protein KF862_19795 [Chitinophagaceae bacterium]|nr:hypothetical protein [Chitinophagaceae bacterium]